MPCEGTRELAWLKALPERLSDADLAEVRAIARRELPLVSPVSPEAFTKAMRRLSVLSRRADDDSTGEERLEVYARLLGHHSAEAIAFMTRTILATEQWFPSPAQCLRVLDGWTRNDAAVEAQGLARHLCQVELERRWQETINRFRRACRGEIEIPQAEIDALPDTIKHRLDCEMLLWIGRSGKWEVRRKPEPQADAGDA